MNDINWTVWLLAAAGGTIVGCIILVVGMWMDKVREERAAEDPISPENSGVYLEYPPQFFPGAGKGEESERG